MCMETYELKHKKILWWQGLLYVVICVAILAALSFGCSFLAFLVRVSIQEPTLRNVLNAACLAFPFVVSLVGAKLLVSHKMQDYQNSAGEKRFMIVRRTGNREKTLVDTNIRDIKWAGDFAALPEEYRGVTKQKLTFLKRETAKAVVFEENKRLRLILLSPSTEFEAHYMRSIAAVREKL